MRTAVFSRSPLRAAVAALLLLLPAAALARAPVCHLCGRTVRSGKRYWVVDSRTYCSKECAERDYERKLPVCSVCGKRCRGRYSVSDGKNFCSRKCLESTLPVCTICGRRTESWSQAEDGSFLACPECMKKPRCFACNVPADGEYLPDGRMVCPKCGADAVSDPEEAERIFRQVRNVLGERFGISTGHRIDFALIDRPTLHRKASGISDTPNELGLFVHRVDSRTTERRDGEGRLISRKTETIFEAFEIFALDHMSREHFEYVCAHELGHDWMEEHFPGISDPETKEGFAEYIGWLYNRMHGRRRLNSSIEKNPDPIYGNGFRRIKKIADREGFEGVRRYLESKAR